MVYFVIFLIFLSFLVVGYFIISKFTTLRYVKKLEKLGDYAIGARNEKLSKKHYKNAIIKYFRHLVLNSVLKGTAIRGIRHDFDDYKNFKNRVITKLNNMLILINEQTISTEISDKFEDKFLEKLNRKNKDSFKNENYDYDKYLEYIQEFENIINREFYPFNEKEDDDRAIQ